MNSISLLLFTLLFALGLSGLVPVEDRGILYVDDALSPVAHASINRQATPIGQCPRPGLYCPMDRKCCEGFCCGSLFPNCYLDTCLNNKGEVPCGPSAVPGAMCGDYCCPGSTFNRCPAKKLPLSLCLTQNGDVSCGGKPGVLCSFATKTCCQHPERCCSTSSTGCCAKGTRLGPFAIASPATGVPGVPPTALKGNAVSSKPTPMQSEAPKPSIQGDIPSGTAEAPEASADSSSTPGVVNGDSVNTEKGEEPATSADSCFPGNVLVELSNGKTVKMSEVKTGDHVRVSTDEFSEIFMWTHHDTEWLNDNYLKLVLNKRESLTASIGHLIYGCKGMRTDCEREPVLIEELQVGDGVWTVGEDLKPVEILKVERVRAKGLYNPQTLSGDIVVNGVLSTCYTRSVPFRAAHGLLAPLRAMYEVMFNVLGTKE